MANSQPKANIQPNRYVLRSDDGTTKVEYDTTSFFGQASLNLSQGPSPIGPIRHFSGSQIRAVSTEIGTLVSVYDPDNGRHRVKFVQRSYSGDHTYGYRQAGGI